MLNAFGPHPALFPQAGRRRWYSTTDRASASIGVLSTATATRS